MVPAEEVALPGEILQQDLCSAAAACPIQAACWQPVGVQAACWQRCRAWIMPGQQHQDLVLHNFSGTCCCTALT